MDKIKKVYIDSRYKTNDSVSNSDFKFELKEALDLPDNTVCYIDDISIPHSWYSIEDFNNKLYIKRIYGDEANPQTTGTILTIPVGNYNTTRLASTLQTLLRARYDGDINFPDDAMTCTYENSRGTIKITANNPFQILSDSEAIYLTENAGPTFIWVGNNHVGTSIDLTNLQSINEALRNDGYVPSSDMYGYTTYESEFIDLLNVHNVYIHCPNLGHYNSTGVRGENSIIKKVPVSSNFGFLILDSVVAPHDKLDVSHQSIKTMHFSLKNVHGNTINLHGSHISLSLIFQTYE